MMQGKVRQNVQNLESVYKSKNKFITSMDQGGLEKTRPEKTEMLISVLKHNFVFKFKS